MLHGKAVAPACLSALPWGLLQGCPGGPSPGPTEGSRWPRLSLKPLALADPVSRGPRRLLVSMPVEAGLAASGRGAQAPPSTAALSSPCGGCREAVTGVWCGGVAPSRAWLCPFTSEPPFGKRSPRDLHRAAPGRGWSKAVGGPGGLEPLLGGPRGPGAEAAFEGLASGHGAPEPGRREAKAKAGAASRPLPGPSC